MRVEIFILALVACAFAAPSLSSNKINPKLLKSLQSKQRVNIMIGFESTQETLASVSAKTKNLKHGQKSTVVYEALKAHADKSQAIALQMLNSPRFFTPQIKSFWISNTIYVQGADAAIIQALALLDEVKEIHEEIVIALDNPTSTGHATSRKLANEWNIDKIRAPEAWEVAGDGEGGIVGIIDTGARHTHEAISHNYRGGTHSWYDAFKQSEEPRDGAGHGTHCTGTIAGSHGIGVAPGCTWISCKGLNDFGIGGESSLTTCGQFMLCPTDYLGNNPDCSLAPHVVSNSWGGTAGQTFFDSILAAWLEANIIPVIAAGNNGPQCESLGYPADSAQKNIGVAATNDNDAIARFSSRGPPITSQDQKPDIAAPGVDINSASIASDTSYETMSGTSMATPHVAGLVTLLKAQNNNIDFDSVWTTLTETAVQDLTFGTSECGEIGESVFPNYSFGYGRIDALAAVQYNFKN